MGGWHVADLWKSKKQKVGLFTRISMGGNMLICVQGRKEKEERKLVTFTRISMGGWHHVDLCARKNRKLVTASYGRIH